MLAVILQQGLCFQGPPGEKKQSQSWHPMPYASVLETNHILIQCLKKKISKLWPWTICLCLWIKFYWNPFFFHWNDSNSYWDRVYYVPWSFIHEASPPSPHPRPGPAPYPLTHHSLTHLHLQRDRHQETQLTVTEHLLYARYCHTFTCTASFNPSQQSYR